MSLSVDLDPDDEDDVSMLGRMVVVMGMRACEGERQQGTRVTKERGREGGRRWEAARHAVGDGVGGGAGRSYSAAADRGGMDVSGEHWVGVEAYSGRLLPESARPVPPLCPPGRPLNPEHPLLRPHAVYAHQASAPG